VRRHREPRIQCSSPQPGQLNFPYVFKASCDRAAHVAQQGLTWGRRRHAALGSRRLQPGGRRDKCRGSPRNRTVAILPVTGPRMPYSDPYDRVHRDQPRPPQPWHRGHPGLGAEAENWSERHPDARSPRSRPAEGATAAIVEGLRVLSVRYGRELWCCLTMGTQAVSASAGAVVFLL